MDRNEKFRQKLYGQKMVAPQKGKVYRVSGDFDTEPYVDLIMERLEDEIEDGEDSADDFFKNIMDNPKLEIIFGKASVLNMGQKALIIVHLEQRLKAIHDFDPTPYVDELITMFVQQNTEPLKKYDNEGNYVYDIELYFKKHNFTKEQYRIIEEEFNKKQSGRAKKHGWRVIPSFILGLLIVLVTPFFIPNFMQSKGWLPIDAGWFSKIGVGLLSMVILFFVVKKLFFMILDLLIKDEKLLNNKE